MTLDEAFWRIHTGLPRQAPGSDATTLHLLELAGKPIGIGLEVGCGQGRASILLAQSGITLKATDTYQPFLDELEEAAKTAGLSEKITTRNISMDALDYSDESFDVLWAESAAYIIGWEKAIGKWKRLVKPGGLLVATDCCWLTDTPSDSARQFWADGYPTMLTVDAAKKAAVREDCIVVASYVFPVSDWFDEYYTPMRQKHALYDADTDEDMQQAIVSRRREIELYEQHGDEYGYVGFVLKTKPTDAKSLELD